MTSTQVPEDVTAGIEAFVAEKKAREQEAAALPTPREARRIRERSGTSIREMATILKVTPKTIVKWEHGRSTPTREHAARWRQLLDALDRVGPPPRRKAVPD
jgi:DNA-binding transcriptional regulator YiaG